MKTSTATSRTSTRRTPTRNDASSFEARPARPAGAHAPRWGTSGASSFTPFSGPGPVSLRPEPRAQLMSQEMDDLMPPPGEYSVTGPEHLEHYELRGERMSAERYEVEIRGQRVPVIVGQGEVEPGMRLAEVEEVAQALARLPDEALREVKEVQVSPHRNPDDAYWAREYDNPDFRSGMTTGAAGITTIYPHPYRLDDAEVAATLLHETTHAWTNREWGTRDTEPEWRAWAAAAAADGRATSDYATASVKEDVCETAELYLATRGTPAFERARALYPHRFAILDERFGGDL